MVKKCYLFSRYDIDFTLALLNIIREIPCSIKAKEIDSRFVEITITSSEKYIPLIENYLASVI